METVLVTGGTGKFGRVLVKALSQNGYKVVFTSTSKGRIQEFCSELEAAGLEATGITIDLLASEGIKQLLDELAGISVEINHVINNARSLTSLAVDRTGRTRRDSFLSEFEMDVVVPYELSMELSGVEKKPLKSIINIGSQYGIVVPNPKLYGNSLLESPIQYGVSKAALIQLTKELAVRLADKRIRVNCVAYGGVEGRVDADFKQRYSQLTPLQRMLSEDEIPGPVLFLLSKSSSALTGHTIVADGGWTLW